MDRKKRKIKLPWWVPYSVPVIIFAAIMIFIIADKPEYTVTFSPGYDGGRSKTQTVEKKDTVSVPDDIYRPGYIFTGWWYKDEGGWRIWDFENDKVYEDITLTARWERVTYTIHLDANGGECDMTEYKAYPNEKLKLPIPTREGYTFAGWFIGEFGADNGLFVFTGECYAKAKWVTYPLGMTVTIGRFEQDNHLENGPEEIEWYVIDCKDGKYFLVSKYLLTYHRYAESNYDRTWETSLLRAYLNGEFYDTAFTEQEKQFITPTVLPEGVTDRVFSLSKQDVTDVVIDGFLVMGIATDYAVSQGLEVYNVFFNPMHENRVTYDIAWYFLRGASALPGGFGNTAGKDGVRPAMWIDESYVDQSE